MQTVEKKITSFRTSADIANDMRDTIKKLESLMNEGRGYGIVLNFNINEVELVVGKRTFCTTTTIQKIETL